MKASHIRALIFPATIRMRQPRRCALCRSRRAEVFLDTVRQDPDDSLPAPTLPTSPVVTWSMCLDCHARVQWEALRAHLHSPDRLLVAIGVVAAERAPRPRLLAWSSTCSQRLRKPLTREEADMLFLLMIMLVTISGMIIGLTALALATSHLF